MEFTEKLLNIMKPASVNLERSAAPQEQNAPMYTQQELAALLSAQNQMWQQRFVGLLQSLEQATQENKSQEAAPESQKQQSATAEQIAKYIRQGI